MTPYITRSLAQQIVETVKDLCGQNVNFIERSGKIFASTDETRIGTFHEIGRQAAENGKAIEVTKNDQFTGTQKGVNLPVYHNHVLIAVIGITGEPEKVRKYARLAERITRLLIREKELDAFNRTEAEKKSYILRGLVDQEEIHPDYLRENLQKWKINEKDSYYLLRLKITDSSFHNTSGPLESSIHRLFMKMEITLSTFVYPDEYLAVLKSEIFHHRRNLLTDFAQEHNHELCIAVGNPTLIHNISDSAFSASIALRAADSEHNYIEAENLDLELILASANAQSKRDFLKKTLAELSEEDKNLLKIYFSCNMSLKETCEKTFLHKNTIQYRLNQIYNRCGYNPRDFQDAVRLYLALKLDVFTTITR